jgi:pre-mRNA-splicing helicase BRR2
MAGRGGNSGGGGGGGNKPDLSGYNYGAISSLVLTTDRSKIPRQDKEPDGAPTSLAGRIDVKEMGSRVQRAQPKDLDKKKRRALDRGGDESAASSGKAKRKAAVAEGGFGYADVIEATQDVGELTYRPRTTETREVFELILSAVHRALGDQAQDVVRSAADAVLETLKSDGMKDFDKKKEVEDVLGPVATDSFAMLVNLSKKITDYGAEEKGNGKEEGKNVDGEGREGEIDDEMGVAVVFDEEEQDEDEEEGFEIRDDSDDDEDDENANADGDDSANVPESLGEDGETLIVGTDSSTNASRRNATKADKDIVSPHSIDAFWVQRQISELYPDPATAAEKATSVLAILGSDASLRDAENELMALFDYQSFEVLARFLKNREVVVWTTKLMRSDADERVNVEVAMRERNLGWILRDLSGDRTAKGAGGDSMDVDAPASASVQVPKTGTLAPGSVVQPKGAVDLESMAFSQGGHLMSNKKVKLPDGSFKRSRKGWEEIHVPPPKTNRGADGEKLVQIGELPEWMRDAFPGYKSLNRVQSKMYPTVCGTEEPLLLCAPTSAGKVESLHSFTMVQY